MSSAFVYSFSENFKDSLFFYINWTCCCRRQCFPLTISMISHLFESLRSLWPKFETNVHRNSSPSKRSAINVKGLQIFISRFDLQNLTSGFWPLDSTSRFGPPDSTSNSRDSERCWSYTKWLQAQFQTQKIKTEWFISVFVLWIYYKIFIWNVLYSLEHEFIFDQKITFTIRFVCRERLRAREKRERERERERERAVNWQVIQINPGNYHRKSANKAPEHKENILLLNSSHLEGSAQLIF